MKRIGLTGGIGSGKSTVGKVFRLAGIPVYDADRRAAFLQDHDDQIKNSISLSFGMDSYGKDGKLDRPKLASQVFADSEKLALLNSIVHPAVARDFDEWVVAQKAPFIIKEAAIIFETGSNLQLNKVIVVTAPLELRIARVMKRSEIHRDEILKRMNQQWQEERLIEKADYLIANDECHLVIPRIIEIIKELSY